MVKRQNNTQTDIRCSQCGSQLIFVSEEIVQPEGTRYPQTNTVYRCSNTECQARKNKEEADRVKMQQERLVKKNERLEKSQERHELYKRYKKQV